jgi:hypothetical protein
MGLFCMFLSWFANNSICWYRNKFREVWRLMFCPAAGGAGWIVWLMHDAPKSHWGRVRSEPCFAALSETWAKKFPRTFRKVVGRTCLKKKKEFEVVMRLRSSSMRQNETSNFRIAKSKVSETEEARMLKSKIPPPCIRFDMWTEWSAFKLLKLYRSAFVETKRNLSWQVSISTHHLRYSDFSNSVAFSPQANYTDRATATCWRS